MRKTSLHICHLALQAKMVPFAGFEMPIKYIGIVREHHAVRDYAGLFDVSHMGEFLISGPQAVPFIQYVFSNNVERLDIGQAQYGYMPNAKGGIVDDLLVYRIDHQRYMLVVNAANIEKDWNWLVTHNKMFGATLENQSEKWSLLALQGPKATPILATLTEATIAKIPFYSFIHDTVAGVENVLISATGYTGSGGYELYVPNAHAEKIWNSLIENGAEPCGLAARNTLRIEMGYCLYGNDIDDCTSPISAGLRWCTEFSKDFVSKDIIEQQKVVGTNTKRVGFVLNERGIPRQGYSLKDVAGNDIGIVTSGTQSPSLEKGIGMGYVGREHAIVGNNINVIIRNKSILATITSLPFYHAS
ncbi:MAG: glycine cleavage system aminomethyltransferase GcvT [Bacteroidota bacterium]|nr:glycine cleavage system aminomethyltransferase GcvT [Bacteroidota bacterium]